MISPLQFLASGRPETCPEQWSTPANASERVPHSSHTSHLQAPELTSLRLTLEFDLEGLPANMVPQKSNGLDGSGHERCGSFCSPRIWGVWPNNYPHDCFVKRLR